MSGDKCPKCGVARLRGPGFWEPSLNSNRDILGLYRDGLLVCSIVQDPAGWRPAVPLDYPVMRPDDKAEVTRMLVELNGEIL